MKYKTVELSYGNGQRELITGMASHGWGLVNIQKPDYATGDIYFYYTFAASDNVSDVEFNYYDRPMFSPSKES